MQALGGPALEKRVRIAYLDQRGSGRSDRPKDQALYSLALIGNDIDAVRETLGAGKVVLLAHSAGTMIALEYAAAHPEHVAGLILTGAVPDLPAAADALCDRVRTIYPKQYPQAVAAAKGGARCDPFAWGNDKQRQAFNDANMFPDPQVRDRVNWLDHIPGVANDGTQGSALFRKGILRYRFAHPERLTMPVLFIAGGRDFQTAIPPQRALAAKLRDGRVVVYPSAGHFMFAEEPERFARDVAEFVARVSR
jgi:proline iminopeptidase